jgi:uncharacterized RDD family membrane protein YckC
MKFWRQFAPREPDEQPCELEYVGFWARAWAGLIDLSLLAALAMPLVPVARLVGAGNLQQVGAGTLLWLLPSGAAALIFYLTPATTLGKLAISAVVVDERTGCPPGLAQQLGRSLGLLLSMAPLGLGFLWVAFHPRKQAWHDKLAGTLVVRARRRGAAAPLKTRASYQS